MIDGRLKLPYVLFGRSWTSVFLVYAFGRYLCSIDIRFCCEHFFFMYIGTFWMIQIPFHEVVRIYFTSYSHWDLSIKSLLSSLTALFLWKSKFSNLLNQFYSYFLIYTVYLRLIAYPSVFPWSSFLRYLFLKKNYLLLCSQDYLMKLIYTRELI